MHPLKKLVQRELYSADPELLVEVALNLWYESDPMPKVLEVLDCLEGVELRRALYTLDRLRRYGTALTRQRYEELTTLVRSTRWEHLKIFFVSAPPASQGQASLSADFLAQGWGLGRQERLQTACILPFQTRHYAAHARR